MPKPGRSASFYLPKLDKVHRHSVTHSHLLLHMCRELSLVLYGNLEGWDGGTEGAQEGGDMCLIMADLYCHTPETTTL